MLLNFLEKYRDFGLLFLRLGIGAMFMFHGFPKITGGPEVWEKLGMATANVGINFAPTFFGFMAAVSEFVGGICLILGLGTRLACCFLFITMTVATSMHLNQGDGLKVASHAIEAGILFFSLIFIGPGKYSLDEKICQKGKA